jgi:hypothetical protein
MKLYAESLQNKIEELEKKSKGLNNENNYNHIHQQNYNDIDNYNIVSNQEKEKEIKNNKIEIENLKKLVMSYEENNLKIIELENKINSNKLKYERELYEIEAYYKDKIIKQEKLLLKNNIINNNNPNIYNNGNIINKNHNNNNLEHKLHFKDKIKNLNSINSNYSQCKNIYNNNISGDKGDIYSKRNSISRTIDNEIDNKNVLNLKRKSRSPSYDFKLNNKIGKNEMLDKRYQLLKYYYKFFIKNTNKEKIMKISFQNMRLRKKEKNH